MSSGTDDQPSLIQVAQYLDVALESLSGYLGHCRKTLWSSIGWIDCTVNKQGYVACVLYRADSLVRKKRDRSRFESDDALDLGSGWT